MTKTYIIITRGPVRYGAVLLRPSSADAMHLQSPLYNNVTWISVAVITIITRVFACMLPKIHMQGAHMKTSILCYSAAMMHEMWAVDFFSSFNPIKKMITKSVN